MSNQYSIADLVRLSPEEAYGFDPIERDRLLEVQADIDMDNDLATPFDDAEGEQQAEGAWLRQAESQGWQEEWQERLNEDLRF
jgi:hypothetical protein